MKKTFLRLFILTDMLLMLGVAGTAVVSSRLVAEVRQDAQADQARLKQAEAIFVLGYCAHHGEVSDVFRMRLDKGYELWKQLRRPIWLLGGVVHGEPKSNAYYGKQYLLAKGVPERWIRIHDEFSFLNPSLDTFNEVRCAQSLAKKQSVRTLVAVSDAVHLAQVKEVFAGSGLTALMATTQDSDPVLDWKGKISYQAVRRAALMVSLVDREGKTLFWVRDIRRKHYRSRYHLFGI